MLPPPPPARTKRLGGADVLPVQHVAAGRQVGVHAQLALGAHAGPGHDQTGGALSARVGWHQERAAHAGALVEDRTRTDADQVVVPDVERVCARRRVRVWCERQGVHAAAVGPTAMPKDGHGRRQCMRHKHMERVRQAQALLAA